MGGHRWLLGPLICLILATTSARPPECQEAPSWTINGEQPLAKTKGKASILEALLNHFRSYGMNDLEFIIVNSKLSHSQDKLHELQKRVSFDVYQETDEEEVWSVMEGGKDDMYVYDRCGRLTYFIPFPLSILNESPLVSNAILDTYYRNPCGESCDQNKTLDINEIMNNIEKNFEESNTTEQEQDNVVYVITEENIADNGTTNANEVNGTLNSNDLLGVIALENTYDLFNLSNISNKTYFENATLNVSSEINETNSTSIDEAKTFFSNIYRVFFNTEMNNQTNLDTNTNETTENIPSNSTDVPTESRTELYHKHHSHHKHGHKDKSHQLGKKKSNRCLEADYEVCKNWSKKRLLIAQRCCSETLTEADLRYRRSCLNFGKKRCKKIQSILKCCIKTVYTEPAATPTPTTTTEVSELESTEITFTVVPQVTECCKTTDEIKICRITPSGGCDEDEEISLRELSK